MNAVESAVAVAALPVAPSIAFSWTCVFLRGGGERLAIYEAEKVRPSCPVSARHTLDLGGFVDSDFE
jgi:hypothetical protein